MKNLVKRFAKDESGDAGQKVVAMAEQLNRRAVELLRKIA